MDVVGLRRRRTRASTRNRIVTGFAIPPREFEQLERLAATEHRSRSAMVAWLVARSGRRGLRIGESA
jgi:hypothetical protein